MNNAPSAGNEISILTGTVRLCPYHCSSFKDATPSGGKMVLTASPPTPGQPYGELVATMLKGGEGPILAGGEVRLKQSDRLNCDGALSWRRTDCAKVTITYQVPRDCNWYQTIIRPARPPHGNAHGTPDWEWRVESKYPTGKVLYPGQDDDARRPRGEKLTHTLTTLNLAPGCRILAEEYFQTSADTHQTALQAIPFGTPTLTGGYLTGMVDQDKRLYKAVVFNKEHTVMAGDWRAWENGIPSGIFVILGPNCLQDDSGQARPCPRTRTICSESDEFEAFGPNDILDVDDYVIVPVAIQGITPIGPAIHEYGPRDWAALLDAQVAPAVVDDRDIQENTADITF